jgi:hypothetical protein
MKNTILHFLVLSVSLPVWATTPPTNNPYRSFYPNTLPHHWTDSLSWHKVIDVTTKGIIPNDNIDDLAATQQLMKEVSEQGGGVLFFPSGTYNFSDHLYLKDKVILRGVSSENYDARTPYFAPKTYFEFPKFNFTGKVENVDNRNKAFKKIMNFGALSHVAIVDIDINRANIFIHPRYETNKGKNNQDIQPLDKVYNILIMGIRQNNTATPTPSVPKKIQEPWQLWPWKFDANIDITVQRNAVVCNSRINDLEKNQIRPIPHDAFEQPGYLLGNGFEVLEERQATFDYTTHYGVVINRFKRLAVEDVRGFADAAGPDKEPLIYATGIEVKHNWIYKTSRVGVLVSGLGAIVAHNQITDKPDKETWIDNTGLDFVNISYYGNENKGIDIGGWKTWVDNNRIYTKVEVKSVDINRTDGQSIIYRHCCGSTQANGLTITNNHIESAESPIFVESIRISRGVHIENNTLSGSDIDVFTQGNYDMLEDITIKNNKKVNNILLDTKNNSRGNNYCYNNDYVSQRLTCGTVIDEKGSKINEDCIQKLNSFDNLPIITNTLKDTFLLTENNKNIVLKVSAKSDKEIEQSQEITYTLFCNGNLIAKQSNNPNFSFSVPKGSSNLYIWINCLWHSNNSKNPEKEINTPVTTITTCQDCAVITLKQQKNERKTITDQDTFKKAKFIQIETSNQETYQLKMAKKVNTNANLKHINKVVLLDKNKKVIGTAALL